MMTHSLNAVIGAICAVTMGSRARVVLMVAGAMLVVASTGCYSTWEVAPKSVESLNGYTDPAEMPLADVNGEQLTFNRSTELHFFGGDVAPKAKFSSIRLSGSMLTGTVLPDNNSITIDLSHVTAIKARKFSPFKTALAIGIPIVAVTALIILVAATSASSACDGC